jgi:hypothetical protein
VVVDGSQKQPDHEANTQHSATLHCACRYPANSYRCLQPAATTHCLQPQHTAAATVSTHNVMDLQHTHHQGGCCLPRMLVPVLLQLLPDPEKHWQVVVVDAQPAHTSDRRWNSKRCTVGESCRRLSVRLADLSCLQLLTLGFNTCMHMQRTTCCT